MQKKYHFNHLLFILLPSFITGIIFSAYWPIILVIPSLITLVSFISRKKNSAAMLLICQFTYLLGSFLSIAQHKQNCIDSTKLFKQFDLLGTVTNSERKNGIFPYFFDVAGSTLIGENKLKTEFNKTIRFYCKKRPATLVGDTIQINNISFKPLSNKSFERYLIKEGVASTIFMKNSSINLLSRPSFSIKRFLHQKRATITASITKKMNALTQALFQLIFLGKQCKTWQIKKIRAACQEWGASHMLARSGIHLLLFIIIWSWLMRLCVIPLLLRYIILLLFITVLALLSWPSVSFLRSFYTFGWYFLLKIANHQIHTLHVFFLITFITLLYNPILIYFLDFQLSFGMTFALAIFSHIKHLHKTNN